MVALMSPTQGNATMSLNHFIAYAIDLALAGALLAGFFGAMRAMAAINLALMIYAMGFIRSVLS
jgi:hypothetical protein